MAIDIELKKPLEIEISADLNLPIDVYQANAKEDDVSQGKTFFAGGKDLKTGTLKAYKVIQTLLGENDCKFEIISIGNPNYDEITTKKNIDFYKFQDQQRIIREGGELATDEEYIETEKYLQDLYKRIMGVEENG